MRLQPARSTYLNPACVLLTRDCLCPCACAQVLCLQRCPDDELLILATDGLWDVFSCQEAATLALRSTVRARQRGASSSAACRVGASVLVRGAMERGSRDNITVAVIDLRARQEEEGGRVASVASVLASQCSSDLAGWAALAAAAASGAQQQQQGGSRKRRSSSGNDEEQQDGAYHPPAQPSHHTGSSAAPKAPEGAVAAPAAGHAATHRRHTTNGLGPAAHEAAAGGGAAAAAAGASGTGRCHPGGQGAAVSWGWSLQQGMHMLPHSRDSPSSSIRALAQAAAAAVAAFSGTMSGVDRSVSGIPREVATGRGQPAAAAAAAPTAAAAGAGDRVTGPGTPTMADLLSMQSAPALRHSGGGGSSGGGGGSAPRGSSGGKPPLPHQVQRGSAAGAGVP